MVKSRRDGAFFFLETEGCREYLLGWFARWGKECMYTRENTSTVCTPDKSGVCALRISAVCTPNLPICRKDEDAFFLSFLFFCLDSPSFFFFLFSPSLLFGVLPLRDRNRHRDWVFPWRKKEKRETGRRKEDHFLLVPSLV